MSMNRPCCWIVALSLACASFEETPAEAPLPKFSDELSAQERALAKLAFEGWWDGRERLISGEVRVETIPQGGPPMATPLFMAFDRAHSLFRFDQTIHGRKTQTSRTPKDSLLHVSGSGSVTRHPPEFDFALDGAVPIDLQRIGISPLVELVLRSSMEGFRKHLAQTPCVGCDRLPEGVIRVRLDHFDTKYQEKFRRTILFKEDQDYAPIEMIREVLSRPETSPLKIGPMDEVRTRWEEQNGAWVPIQMSARDHWSNWSAEVSFSWSHVNEPVPQKLFQPEGFDLPPETSVFDRRLGEPIFERDIGSDREVDRVNMTRETASAPNWRAWVLWGNLAAITVIGGLLLRRWARSP